MFIFVQQQFIHIHLQETISLVVLFVFISARLTETKLSCSHYVRVCVGGGIGGCADVEISNVASGWEIGRSKLGFGVHTHIFSLSHTHTRAHTQDCRVVKG